MLVSLEKKYRTRDGCEVRIYAVDGCKPYPVQGAVLTAAGWVLRTWLYTGNSFGELDSPGDLIEVKPTHTRWYIVLADGAYGFKTKHEALLNIHQLNRAYLEHGAIVQVTFTEGEGIE